MFTCVKDGKRVSSVYIPAWAQSHEVFAAEELSRYIRKVTGAELPVVRALRHVRPGSLVLGDLSHPGTPALLPERIGEGLRYDGFRMRTVKGVLYIVSKEPAGVVFGAYEYLRRHVGCSFPDYGESGENLPRQRTIRHADVDLLDNPRIWYRGLQASCEPEESLGPRVDWMAKNGFSHLLVSAGLEGNGWEECREWLMPELRKRGLKLAFGHHIFSHLLPVDQFLKERTDFYAKRDGKRSATPQLRWCLSNEELIKTVASSVIRTVKENPELDTFELWPDDGVAPACECRDCAKLDDPRDTEATEWGRVYGRGGKRGDKGKMRRYLHLANKVAERLAAAYPQVRLNVISYADLSEPPVDAYVHPNIIICLAVYWRCNRHGLYDPKCRTNRDYQECIRQWLEVTPADSLIFYDYYMGMGCWASLPYPVLTNLFKEWDTQVRFGMGGSHVQSGTKHIASYGINYLAFARLAREDRPKLDEFIDSYCRDYFGPAAEPMAKVYRVWEKCMQTGNVHRMVSPPDEVKGLFTESSVKACRKHIAKALSLTDDAVYRWRIERILALVDYIQIWREMPASFRKARRGQKLSERVRANCLAWAQRMHDFAEKHLALDDDIFPGNPADRLLKSLED